MSDPLTIFATAPLRGAGIETLENIGQLVYEPWIDGGVLRLLDENELAARIDELDARTIICEADPCKGPVLERNLLAIASTRGDPSNVDVDAATAAGIPVLHAPGRNADAVAEHTLALLLAVTRHVVCADRDVRAGDIYREGTIPYQRFRAWQLAGRTAGIVGLGAIGRALRWRLEGLGMAVISTDPYNDEATHTLEALLSSADIVTIHAPPTPDTLGMIGPDQFDRMKDGAIFLNAARAALHDMDALVAALGAGKLAGAGIDHFEGEYLPPDHPLCAMDNVVLTPHIGGATYDTEVNHTSMIAADLERIVNGEHPIHCANPEVLGKDQARARS